MNCLLKELLSHTFTFVPLSERSKLQCVCQQWRCILQNLPSYPMAEAITKASIKFEQIIQNFNFLTHSLDLAFNFYQTFSLRVVIKWVADSDMPIIAYKYKCNSSLQTKIESRMIQCKKHETVDSAEFILEGTFTDNSEWKNAKELFSLIYNKRI